MSLIRTANSKPHMILCGMCERFGSHSILRVLRRWNLQLISAVTVSIREAVVPERLPQVNAHLRIGEIELGPDAIERLLGDRIAGHKKRESLMPLAGAGHLLLG